MPGMWHHPSRGDGWMRLDEQITDDTDDDDGLAQFIAENDVSIDNQSPSVNVHWFITVRQNLVILNNKLLNLGRNRLFMTLFSCFLLVSVVGISLGLGAYSWWGVKPEPVIDKSIEAFNIPNHKAYIRFNTFILAKEHNSTKGRFRKKRDVSEVHVETGKKNFLVNPSLQEQSKFENFDGTDLEEEFGETAGKLHSRQKRFSGCVDNQLYPRWKMQVIFLAQGDHQNNMFTKERLETVHNVEKKIIAHRRYPKFCLRDPRVARVDPAVLAHEDCVPLNSLMTYFFPSKDSEGRVHYDGLGNNLDEVDSALKLAMNHKTFYYYVDDKINKTFHRSRLLRTEVVFGVPLPGFCLSTRKKEQEQLFKDFIVTYIDVLSSTSTDKVKVLYGGNELFDYEVDHTFWQDLRMAYIAFLSIVLFMFVLTSFSVWLTFWGMVSIILSFPLALYFYRVNFHIDALGILNGAAAFVIIGIGVDDVFVFVNIFHQAGHMKCPLSRLGHTVMTAGKATFFTSFTTAAAFAANIASSIPAVSEFGLFMSLIVSSCWITVTFIMPPALYLWLICFSHCEKGCFACIKLIFTRKRVATPLDAHQISVSTTQQGAAPDDDDDDVPLIQIENRGVISDDNDVPMLIPDPYYPGNTEVVSTDMTNSAGDDFYIGKFLQIALTKYLAKVVIKGRWLVIGIFVALLMISIGLATQLHPATKPPQLFRADTNLQQLLDLKANYSIIDTLRCDRCSAFYKILPTKKPYNHTVKMTPHSRPVSKRPVPPVHDTTTRVPYQPATSAKTTAASRQLTTPVQHLATPRRQNPTTATPARPIDNVHHQKPVKQPPHLFPPTEPPSHFKTNKASSVQKNFNACEGHNCNNLKDRPVLQTGTIVYVVFGIKDLDRSAVQAGHVMNEYQGKVVFDKKFEQNSVNPNVLKDLCRLCKLIANNTELVRQGGANCLPKGIPRALLAYVQEIEECRDLPTSHVDHHMQTPATAAGGISMDRKIIWLAFAFESTTTKGLAYFEAYKKYQKWEDFIEHLKDSVLSKDSPLHSMFQTSEFWKKVLMEVVAVSSAIYGLVLSMVICVIAIAIFTGNVILLVIIVCTIFAMICLVVAIFYLAGWEIGAVEALSLSILVGSSVDYCVHLVEGYLLAGKHAPHQEEMTKSTLRQWRTSMALRHIGVAIVSSAITTVIAAIPLTQTTIKPFAKFGDIILINTSVSIVFTLTLCAALLSAVGPPKFISSWKSSGIAFIITGAVIGAITLILFIVSRTTFDIPGPNGEPLFPR